jgi:hypothetical protein
MESTCAIRKGIHSSEPRHFPSVARLRRSDAVAQRIAARHRATRSVSMQ